MKKKAISMFLMLVFIFGLFAVVGHFSHYRTSCDSIETSISHLGVGAGNSSSADSVTGQENVPSLDMAEGTVYDDSQSSLISTNASQVDLDILAQSNISTNASSIYTPDDRNSEPERYEFLLLFASIVPIIGVSFIVARNDDYRRILILKSESLHR